MKTEYTQIRVALTTKKELKKIANESDISMHKQIIYWIEQHLNSKKETGNVKIL